MKRIVFVLLRFFVSLSALMSPSPALSFSDCSTCQTQVNNLKKQVDQLNDKLEKVHKKNTQLTSALESAQNCMYGFVMKEGKPVCSPKPSNCTNLVNNLNPASTDDTECEYGFRRVGNHVVCVPRPDDQRGGSGRSGFHIRSQSTGE